jgi:hypothetical protein
MGFNSYTTTDLVNNVKIVGHLPTGNNTFTPASLITLADRELQTPILKQILSTRGGYYLTYSDYSERSDGLYPIPPDCVMGVLENVEIVQDSSIIQVNPIEESEQMSTISPTSTSYGYFMKGNSVQILPTPNNGTVRLWYAGRPSRLVPTSSCAQITAIVDTLITVSSVPTTFLTDYLIDAIGDQPPFNVLGTQTITNINGTELTLDLAVDGLAIGDWICLNKQTCVPQIPVEFRPLLEQRVVCQAYESQGYLDKLAAAQKKLEELEKATFALITPRVKSRTKVIAPVNGGFLSGGRRITNFPAAR